MTHASTVEAKEAVIRPQAGIDARYFNIVLQKNVAQFMEKYATGLNIQEKEIANFPIQLHNVETQKAIADMMKYMDDKADTIESEIAGLKKLKKAMLEKLMV